ncbi:MAG: 30S ribosomal protein S20 [Candidatus Ryanbacteria bacterium]|nr:30S ribosomal protein S20 [Candidatus Ryanbacteria bacterium]
MPNTRSAKKALRQSHARRERNITRKRALRDMLKRMEKALLAKNKKEAAELFPLVQKVLDKSAKTNIIKKNTASRKKSRLSRELAKI